LIAIVLNSGEDGERPFGCLADIDPKETMKCEPRKKKKKKAEERIDGLITSPFLW